MTRIIGFAGVATVATLGPLAAAGAVDYPSGGNPPEVQPNTQVQGATAQQSGTAQTLPFTGGDVVGLALIGAGAVTAGAVAVRRSRA